MDKVSLTKMMVLKATYMDLAPVEAIRNRLGSGYPKAIARFDPTELKLVLKQLSDMGLVMIKEDGPETLYHKVPKAVSKLAQMEKNIGYTQTNP